MPLQFEAGRMLRSFSDGTPSYPRMLYSNAQQKFRVIPRALLEYSHFYAMLSGGASLTRSKEKP